jgi:dihydroorotase
MSSLLIKGGTIINEGRRYRGDLLIVDGLFTAVNQIFLEDPHVDAVMDAYGLLVMPGIIDDQVHFREPGLEHKGTIASESKAAVAGGITSFMEMPNTKPATTTLQLLHHKQKLASTTSWCNYSFYLGATNTNLDEIKHLNRGDVCGIKVFMGSSTGDLLVDNDDSLREIFRNASIPVAVHSEDEETIKQNLSVFRERFGPLGTAALHPEIRSREACILCTTRAIQYAEETGGHLHLLHLSTAEEVEMIRAAKQRGVSVTAEVCVHHLCFSDQDYITKGDLIKWNPAIKTAHDRTVLREGLRMGILDVVATDHAPHSYSEKVSGYFNAPSGGPLVEHALPMMLNLVSEEVFTLEEVVRWMAHAPAELFKIHKRGFIREGYFADLVIVKPENWTIDGEATHYLVKWSPLHGERMTHRVMSTIVNGNVVYHQGVFFEQQKASMPLRFDR